MLVAMLALVAGSASCQGSSSSGGPSPGADGGEATDGGGDGCPYLAVTCSEDDPAQCPAGMTAFLCTADDDPTSLDSSLVCQATVANPACGTQEYCCQ